jgi:hypothetical protein
MLEIHTAQLLVPGLSPVQVEIATAKLKNVDLQVVIKFWQN